MKLHLFHQFYYFGSSFIPSIVRMTFSLSPGHLSCDKPKKSDSQDDYLEPNGHSWSLGPLVPPQMHAFRLGAPQSLPNPGLLGGHQSQRGQSLDNSLHGCCRCCQFVIP